ncbi:acyl-CoA dehydrogenase family protein [Tomitella biformata]|uniref:acyl-CoA dehydrogenase family protein n=1 Tax=Tomitella biformata TaxID=630403 RepID=UPI00046381F9|nr:acyl-CoA dehydrogenase family protein [Tomitella biformata]
MTTATNTADLTVDADLQQMMTQVLAVFSGPTADPAPNAVWSALTEVGLARLTASELSGGSGAGWAEAAALLRTAAAAGVAVPYAETDLLAGPLRRAAGVDDSSDSTATVALLDSDGTAFEVPWAGSTTTITCVRKAGQGYELADIKTEDLSIVPGEGLSAVPIGTVSVAKDVEWTPVDADAVNAHVLRGALVRALQCVGAMEGMLASAIEHSVARNQFGRALAKFQSVQNLVVDVAAESVLARAAVDTALAGAIANDLTGELSEFQIAVARSVVSQAIAVAVRNTHQVHGAIGTTHEHTLHRLTLPVLQWRGEFGSAAFWESFLTHTAVANGMDGAWRMVVEGTPIDNAAAAYLKAVATV